MQCGSTFDFECLCYCLILFACCFCDSLRISGGSNAGVNMLFAWSSQERCSEVRLRSGQPIVRQSVSQKCWSRESLRSANQRWRGPASCCAPGSVNKPKGFPSLNIARPSNLNLKQSSKPLLSASMIVGGRVAKFIFYHSKRILLHPVRPVGNHPILAYFQMTVLG